MSDLDKLWIALDDAREAYLTALRAAFPYKVGDEVTVRYNMGKYYIDDGECTAKYTIRVDSLEATDWGRITIRGPQRTTKGLWGSRRDNFMIVMHRRPYVPYDPNEPMVARHVQNADRRTVGPLD